MPFMLPVDATVVLRCDYGEGACPMTHVVFQGRLRAGERLLEPQLPEGWTAILCGGPTWEQVVLCPTHRPPTRS